jgi:hypothetical protein
MVTRTTRELPAGAEPGALSPAPRPAFLRRIPVYAYLGVLLNVLAWTSSWARIGPWPYTFFFLWLGFILLLDGLNLALTGTSPLRRGLGHFVMLFVYSAPFWWAFEGLNVPVQNWHYRLDHAYSTLAYVAITSLDFSTVLPAVMELFELFASVPALRPRLRPPELGPRLTVRSALGLFVLGLVLLWLPFRFPTVAFGLVWLCLAFLLDPINNLLGRKSAVGHLLARDWRFFVTLPLATLCCGFFWEMWNSRALPGWYYTVPWVDHAPHLFEMPLPGYLGYLPFGIELFVMYQFALLLTRRRGDALIT